MLETELKKDGYNSKQRERERERGAWHFLRPFNYQETYFSTVIRRILTTSDWHC